MIEQIQGEINPSCSRFEELPVWKTARILSNMIYTITKKHAFQEDFNLKNQIRRAAVRGISNIAEGLEHETQAQFASYPGRAKTSAGEIHCQLYLALDQKLILQDDFDRAHKLAAECSKHLYGLIKFTRSLPKSRNTRNDTHSNTI